MIRGPSPTALERSKPLLCAAILCVLLAPTWARAGGDGEDEDEDAEAADSPEDADTPEPPSEPEAPRTGREILQRDQGLVKVKDSSGGVRKQVRAGQVAAPELALKVLVENTLDRPIRDLVFHLAYGSGKAARERRVVLAPGEAEVPAHAVRALSLTRPLALSDEVSSFTVSIKGYRVVEPDAGTLLKLAASEGAVDMAVAARGIQTADALAPEVRAAWARTFSDVVRKGPRGAGSADTLAPLMALRGLGRVGGADAVPVLLGVLGHDADYAGSRQALSVVGLAYRDHPAAHLFRGVGVPLSELVLQSLEQLSAEVSLPELVAAATGRGVVPARRDELLEMVASGGPRMRARAASLHGVPAAIEGLCRARHPAAVRLLLALAATGADVDEVKGCVAAMPAAPAVAGLKTALLEDALGPAEALAVELMAARGEAARAALRGASSAVPKDAGVAALVQAVLESAKDGRHQKLAAELAEASLLLDPKAFVDEDTRDEAFLTARARLEALEELALDASGRAELARAYALYGRWAARYFQEGRVDGALERISALLGPKPEDGTADEAVGAFAAEVLDVLEGGLDVLKRFPPLVFNRAVLAPPYVKLARKYAGTELQAQYAQRALELDPQSQEAKELLAAIAREHRRPFLILLGILAGLSGLCLAIAWSGRGRYSPGQCVNCGQYAVRHDVRFRYNIGMLVTRRHAEKSGPFCKRCIHLTYWSYTGILVTVGWWGVTSAVMTPLLLLGNGYHYLTSLMMPAGRSRR